MNTQKNISDAHGCNDEAIGIPEHGGFCWTVDPINNACEICTYRFSLLGASEESYLLHSYI